MSTLWIILTSIIGFSFIVSFAPFGALLLATLFFQSATKLGQSKSGRPGFTLYRVNGKVRVRRKADYARIAALEKEFGIGPVEETPAPKRILPPPKPRDAATSARPPWAMTKKPENKYRIPRKDDYNSALFAKAVMDDLAHSYMALHPAYIGEQSEVELRRKHLEALGHAGVLGRDQMREMMESNFTT